MKLIMRIVWEVF